MFRDLYPSEWNAIEEKYGVRGKEVGSRYTANNYVGTQLSTRRNSGALVFVDWMSAPDGWGSPVVALWERSASGMTPVRYSTSLVSDIEQIVEQEDVPETEKLTLILSRIGQDQFRSKLMRYWKGCSVTKCDLTGILIASHIKPWRHCDNVERLDVFNGLLLLPNLDRLFDQGYISFSEDGRIMLSDLLRGREHELGANENMIVNLEAKHETYMKFHRKNIFIRVTSSK